MITIDGKEAGGQVLRTAIGLSAITGKPIRVVNIRGARKPPGLKTQHLEGVLAVGKLCDAKIRGAKLGSTELEFIPGRLRGGDIKVRIGTAGSIGLLFQSLQLPAAFSERETVIEVEGGSTASSWSPTIHYVKHVFLKNVERMGYKADIQVLREGFYPKGGARVKIRVHPVEGLKAVTLTKRGGVRKVEGISVAGSLPEHVARRQSGSAKAFLLEKGFGDVEIENECVESPCPGSSITVWAVCEQSILGGDSIGRKGVRAEVVGEEAAKELWESLNSGAALDKYMADQILVFLALADGKSEVVIEKFTDHCKTNIEVIEKILGVEFQVERLEGELVRVSVKGLGFLPQG